jgi:hypothetical protein
MRPDLVSCSIIYYYCSSNHITEMHRVATDHQSDYYKSLESADGVIDPLVGAGLRVEQKTALLPSSLRLLVQVAVLVLQ